MKVKCLFLEFGKDCRLRQYKRNIEDVQGTLSVKLRGIRHVFLTPRAAKADYVLTEDGRIVYRLDDPKPFVPVQSTAAVPVPASTLQSIVDSSFLAAISEVMAPPPSSLTRLFDQFISQCRKHRSVTVMSPAGVIDYIERNSVSIDKVDGVEMVAIPRPLLEKARRGDID